MSRLVLGAAAALAGLAVAVSVPAAPPPYDQHIEIPRWSFTALALPPATGRVNALASDQVNRVWVATPEGITALQSAGGGTVADPASLLRRAPFFPLDATDGLVSSNATGVAFAAVDGEEHFFAGFLAPPGFQYGRILGTSGLSLPNDSDLYESAKEEPVAVEDVASAGEDRVWTATAGGLWEWKTEDRNPVFEEIHAPPGLPDAPVFRVAVPPTDPSIAAFATAATGAGGRDELWTVASGDPAVTGPLTLPAGLNTVVDLAFDAGGALWVLGGNVSGSTLTSATVWKYVWEADVPGPTLTAYPFSGPGSTYALRALAVDDEQGVVWVATSSGAWFQQMDAAGDLPGSWTDAELPTADRNVYAVYADPAGNLWFGTDQGVNGLMVRLLSLDNSKYIGYGTALSAQVVDLAASGAGSIQVEIQGTPRDLPETSPGVFARTFTFAEDAGGDDGLIEVPSSAAAVEITAEYGYDPADATKKLSAVASWSNEQPFEDDFWLGGPCFLDFLAR